MKRGVYFAFLCAGLAATAACVLVAFSFSRPQTIRHWLSWGTRSIPAVWRTPAASANAEVVARVNQGVVTVIATRAARSQNAADPADVIVPQQYLAPEQTPDNNNFRRGTGTGFVISPDGYIVTNDHVIKDADLIRVKLADGRERRAVLQGTDKATDIALLKIEADHLTVLSLGDSDAVRVGDAVIAIGNPLDYEHSVTAGIVSAKRRKVYDAVPFEDFIQTDAAINRGNSGGPLLNQAGEVVGVNTVIRIDGRGISFAVPSNVVKHVVAQLRVLGRVVRGFLGLRPANLTPEFREGLGLGELQGVLVADVAPESPAVRAGIEVYDVLTHFDGQPLYSSDDYFSAVTNAQPQRDVEIAVVRGGQNFKLRARLDQRQQQEPPRSNETPQSLVKELERTKAVLSPGFTVREHTPEDQRALRVAWNSEAADGVIIAEIDPLGPAANSNLSVGQVVIEANRQPIHNLNDFQRVTAQLREGGVLVLRVSSPHRREVRLLALRIGEER